VSHFVSRARRRTRWPSGNHPRHSKERTYSRRKQIRFADRQGSQRPDDEILVPVRGKKPHQSWSSREKAWQAAKTLEGLQSINEADQELAEIGRRRTGGHER
jgi:hypothetical protein